MTRWVAASTHDEGSSVREMAITPVMQTQPWQIP